MTRDRLERAVLLYYLVESPYTNLRVTEEVKDAAFRWANKVLEGSQSSREEVLASILQEAALSESLGKASPVGEE
jgi:hypothetical protein